MKVRTFKRRQQRGRRTHQEQQEPADSLWAFKRANQRRDLEALRSGRLTGMAMSWFSEDQAVNALVVGQPL